MHHTQFLKNLMDSGRLKVSGGSFRGKKITYHDPCYLGRANGEYEAPRELLSALESELIEMKRCKSRGLCCGAGGAQMFKEPEKGHKDINIERSEEAIETGSSYVATGCPFCNTMMTDGVTASGAESKVTVMDVAELIAKAADL
jgi:Fe-S oxidoreductase